MAADDLGTRNILIHNYDGIDPAIVWGIVERDISSLLAAILVLIDKELPE